MNLRIDLAWILAVAQQIPADPQVVDYRVPVAAEARHRAEILDREVYPEPHHKAAALVCELAQNSRLEMRNLLLAATVTAAHLSACGMPVGPGLDSVLPLARAAPGRAPGARGRRSDQDPDELNLLSGGIPPRSWAEVETVVAPTTRGVPSPERSVTAAVTPAGTAMVSAAVTPSRRAASESPRALDRPTRVAIQACAELGLGPARCRGQMLHQGRQHQQAGGSEDQIRHPTSGQAYHQRKRAKEGGRKEALRRLKRRLADLPCRTRNRDRDTSLITPA
ncbi:hypothetical protein [Actinacidiphila glaucinigra]|uniref:hypothetical protein n=1 Tax=Actinacidiphila glaucinigra TaxID=235986 RepID=UPI0037198A37